MAGSLFDQLKSSGLVDEKKAKQVQREKHQQNKKSKANKAKKGQKQTSQSAQLAQEAAQKQAEQAQLLNQQRAQEQAQKALQAELKQIIENSQIKGYAGDIQYHFVDDGQMQTLQVNAKTQQQLSKESLRIVRFKQGYALIPKETANKIAQRDASCLVAVPSDKDENLSAEDEAYYAKFKIPDDLIW
ncbi:DUF2058 domain-containing protein [Hydrogenovibrio halophilus]|uniref:DUF2058 domain-containing protein n=1 Tax=Hydrogenovibrio halophilus TaxID=373391 RepID=UPI000362883E|nr:DUF2058 domain-containing protein [Hydrogenovibrio halophilus]